MICTCKDWKENIDKIHAPFLLTWARSGSEYEGKIWDFCPWCGEELINEPAEANI
jgi:hypothetical protein